MSFFMFFLSLVLFSFFVLNLVFLYFSRRLRSIVGSHALALAAKHHSVPVSDLLLVDV